MKKLLKPGLFLGFLAWFFMTEPTVRDNKPDLGTRDLEPKPGLIMWDSTNNTIMKKGEPVDSESKRSKFDRNDLEYDAHMYERSLDVDAEFWDGYFND